MSHFTTAQVIHALASHMVPNGRDVIVRNGGASITIVAANEDAQRRLVGRKGQNAQAMAEIARWTGHHFTLAEPDDRAAGQGWQPVIVLEGDSAGTCLFFHDLIKALYTAAGATCNVEVGTDERDIIITAETTTGPAPDFTQTAAIGKVLRAIAVQSGWQDLSFKSV